MPPSVSLEAVRYALAGISVIPVRADKRPYTRANGHAITPDGGWRFAQGRIASEREIETWYRDAPNAGVGIVCGRVSGNLVVLDLDHRPLSDWIGENTAFLSKTWVVRTGSGKLHIYLRSQVTVYTSGINAQGNLHLAEIRADGRPPYEASYVVAPPSPYDFKGIQGSYETLSGSPESIPEVSDAGALLRSVVEMGYSKITGKSTRLEESAPTDSVSTDVMPPGDERGVRKLLVGLVLPGKVRRAILNGAEPGVGEWRNAPSHSEVDHAVMTSLREQGLDHESIERIFAALPVGQACYRNTRRSNHGHRYIVTDLVKIDVRIEARKTAAMSARGANFEVMTNRRTGGDKPVYELGIHRFDSGEHVTAKITPEEMDSQKMFRIACDRTAGFRPQFTDEQSKHWNLFADTIHAMHTVEETPQDATEFGYLMSNVFQILRDNLTTAPPDDPDAALIGWRDDAKGLARIHSRALIQKVGSAVKPSPLPGRIWEVMRSAGATEDTLTVGGKSTQVWILPLKALDEHR